MTTTAHKGAEQAPQPLAAHISSNLSFDGSFTSSGEEDISKSALSSFRAKEEEIERKKMEVRERVLSQLGRVEEESKKLAMMREEYSPAIHPCFYYQLVKLNWKGFDEPAIQELETLSDPMRKEVAHVRKKIDSVNKELKPLGQSVQKKEKEYKEALDAFNDKNKEKVVLINKLVELVTESERVRMKKLEELSRSIDSMHMQ